MTILNLTDKQKKELYDYFKGYSNTIYGMDKGCILLAEIYDIYEKIFNIKENDFKMIKKRVTDLKFVLFYCFFADDNRRNNFKDYLVNFNYDNTVPFDIVVEQLNNLEHMSNLVFPNSMEKDLDFTHVISIENTKFPNFLFGYMNLLYLEQVNNTTFPFLVFNFVLWSLSNGHGVIFPKIVLQDFVWHGDFNLNGASFPEYVGGIFDCKEVTNVSGFKLPKDMPGGIIRLDAAEIAFGLTFPEHFDGEVGLESLTSLKGVNLPKTGEVNFKYLGSRDFNYTLVEMKEIQRQEEIIYNSNDTESVYGNYVFYRSPIDGKLIFGNIDTISTLEKIDSDLMWYGSDIAVNVTVPNHLFNNLKFSKIKTAYGLVFPGVDDEEKTQFIDLSNLTLAYNLVFPEHFNGEVWICSLETLDGVVFPKSGNCTFLYQGSMYSLDEIKEEQSKSLNFVNSTSNTRKKA